MARDGCGNATLSGPENARFVPSLVLASLGVLHLVWSVGLVLRFRRDYDHLRQRQLVLILLVAFGTLIDIFVSLLNFVVLPVPPWFDMAASLVLVPILTVSIPVKLLEHYNRHVFAMVAAHAQINLIMEEEFVDSGRNETQSIHGSGGTAAASAISQKLGGRKLQNGTLFSKGDSKGDVAHEASRNVTFLFSDPGNNIPDTGNKSTSSLSQEDIFMIEDRKGASFENLAPTQSTSGSSITSSPLKRSDSMLVSPGRTRRGESTDSNLEVDRLVNGPAIMEINKHKAFASPGFSTSFIGQITLDEFDLDHWDPSKGQDSRKKLTMTIRRAQLLKFLSSSLFFRILLFVYILPFVCLAIANMVLVKAYNPYSGCFPSSQVMMSYVAIPIIVSSLLALLFGLFGALLVRNTPDPFGIANECRVYLQYGGFVAVMGVLLSYFCPTTYMNPQFTFRYLTFIGIQMLLFTTTSLQVYIAMIRCHGGISSTKRKLYLLRKKKRDARLGATSRPASQRLKRGSADGKDFLVPQGSSRSITMTPNQRGIFDDASSTNTDGPRELLDVLTNPELTALFEEHLVAELSSEMLRMYLEAVVWEKLFVNSSEVVRRVRAKRIVQIFVKTGSVFEVNLPGNIRENLITELKNHAHPLKRDLFKEAKREMLDMMEGAFIRFSSTEQYKKKIKENRNSLNLTVREEETASPIPVDGRSRAQTIDFDKELRFN